MNKLIELSALKSVLVLFILLKTANIWGKKLAVKDILINPKMSEF